METTQFETPQQAFDAGREIGKVEGMLASFTLLDKNIRQQSEKLIEKLTQLKKIANL